MKKGTWVNVRVQRQRVFAWELVHPRPPGRQHRVPRPPGAALARELQELGSWARAGAALDQI